MVNIRTLVGSKIYLKLLPLHFLLISVGLRGQQNKIDSLNTELEKNQSTGNQQTISENLRALGVAYFEKGDYATATGFYQKGLEVSKEIGDERMQSRCLMNIGNIYLVQDNYPIALEYYNKSLSINERIKDTTLISLSLNNMGILYTNLENFDKALAFSERALEIQKKLGNEQRVAETSISLGLLHIKLKNYHEALRYAKNAHVISESIGNDFINGFALNNIGFAYLHLKDYQKALFNYEMACQINIKYSQRALAGSYFGLAKVNTLLEKYEIALVNAIISKKMLTENNMTTLLRDVEELLSNIYFHLGDYKKALESHQQFKILNDSLFNKKSIEKIAQLESEYKYQQALDSASIRELKLTKTVMTTTQDLAKTKQNYLWAVIGILLTSILSGSFVFYQKYKSVKIMNQNIVTEQKLLRSQMTPHFIFNSLSILQGMILNKEEKKSITYLSKFSKLLRIVLENSRDKVVPLIQELDAIDNYMILQNLDADPPYDYSLVVDENIDINHFLVPPMLIQPFIENAIEHAFTPDQEHREIFVHLTFEHKKLCCTITDNGIGIDAISNKTNIKKKSLATTITKERLEMLAKDFKTPGGITIADRKNDKERGTRVTLIIPYKVDSITS
ncbi:tetratricopeptide repeat-containing sensor histidine kinase [Maribacter algicola]|nr:tetratricopeptide repeat protein [Maribacter algicola]